MAIHKLATGPVTITVAKCESVEGQFGNQVVFYGEGDVLVYVSEMTAMRQLARLNLTPETVIGKAIYLEQIKKDGKTFTNIALAAAGDTPAAPATTIPARVMPAALTFEETVALYARCVDAAFATFGIKCEEAGVAYDAASLQAAAATLFIKATR